MTACVCVCMCVCVCEGQDICRCLMLYNGYLRSRQVFTSEEMFYCDRPQRAAESGLVVKEKGCDAGGEVMMSHMLWGGGGTHAPSSFSRDRNLLTLYS